MAGIIVLVLVYGFGLAQLPANPLIYIYGTITGGLPGIIAQLILVPVIIRDIKGYKSATIE